MSKPKARVRPAKITRKPSSTSKRIANLEKALARHERKLAQLREIIQNVEVNAIMTAGGVNTLVKRIVAPDFVPVPIPASELPGPFRRLPRKETLPERR